MYVDNLLIFANSKELKKWRNKIGKYGIMIKIEVTHGNRKPDGRYVTTNTEKANKKR